MLNSTYTKEQNKNGDKDGVALYKLMSNAVLGKTIESNRRLLELDVKTKLHVTEKYLSMIQTRYVKVNILTLNKPVYVGMCILDLSKVLMHEFHFIWQ